MAAALCLAANQNPGAVGTGNTRYVAVGVTRFTQSTPEANVQRTVRTPGTYRGLYLRVTSNTSNGTFTVRFRVNAGNGNQVMTVGAGASGEFRDDVNTDTVADGDEIDLQYTNSGTGAVFVTHLASVFTPTNAGETVSCWVGSPNLASPSASTRYFCQLAGVIDGLETTEANRQWKSPIAGTLRNLQWNAPVNGRSTDTILTARINGADTGLTITRGGGVTGIQEDSANQVSVAVDDLISIGCLTGTGTGDITGIVSVEFVTSTGQSVVMVMHSSASELTSATTPRYLALATSLLSAATVEANATTEGRAAFNYSHLRAYISANSLNAGSATLTLRKNTADTALAASHAAGAAAAWIEDVSDSISAIATDELNWAYSVVTASSGVVTVRTIGLVMTAPALSPPPFNRPLRFFNMRY